MTKKIIAILMTMALVLSFAACGAKDDAPTTEPEATVEATAEATAPAEGETDETASVEESSVEESSVEASSEEASSEETSAEASKAPETTEEIVAYFNTSVNKVKSDAKTVTRNYSKITLNGSTTLPKALNGILKLLGGADKFLGDQLAKNSKGSETFNGKAAIQEIFPVENETWASKLTAADVKSATCTEKDGKYTITIVTLSDGKSANVKHGQGHIPKAFNAVLPGIVNDNIPGVATSLVGTATMNYPSSTAKIVVDAATGNVESAQYDLYWTINFDKAGAILPFHTSDSYTVKF